MCVWKRAILQNCQCRQENEEQLADKDRVPHCQTYIYIYTYFISRIDPSKALRNVTQIQATQSAFAALRSDGSVSAWGDDACGGNTRLVQPHLKKVLWDWMYHIPAHCSWNAKIWFLNPSNWKSNLKNAPEIGAIVGMGVPVEMIEMFGYLVED